MDAKALKDNKIRGLERDNTKNRARRREYNKLWMREYRRKANEL